MEVKESKSEKEVVKKDWRIVCFGSTDIRDWACYTSRDMEKLFGISAAKLGRWRKKRMIPFFRITSRKMVYPKWAIDNILRELISRKEQTE